MLISREAVKEKLISYLSKSENTRFMLKTKITTYVSKKVGGFDEAKKLLIEAHLELVLDELEDIGYLSDERYAEIYSKTKSEQGYGRKYILQKLLQKGISNELANKVFKLANIDNVANKERLSELRSKKFGTELPKDFKEKNRQIRFLLSKGYDMDDVLNLFR